MFVILGIPIPGCVVETDAQPRFQRRLLECIATFEMSRVGRMIQTGPANNSRGSGRVSEIPKLARELAVEIPARQLTREGLETAPNRVDVSRRVALCRPSRRP